MDNKLVDFTDYSKNGFHDSKLVDFTVDSKYNRFHDCLIKCNNKIYKTNRIILCKIDYFTTLFTNNMKLDTIESLPCCTFDDKYDSIINKFLTLLYNGVNCFDVSDVRISLEFSDYILYKTMLKIITLKCNRCDYETKLCILPYIVSHKDNIGLDVYELVLVDIIKDCINREDYSILLDNNVHNENFKILPGTDKLKCIKFFEYIYEEIDINVASNNIKISDYTNNSNSYTLDKKVYKYILDMNDTDVFRNCILLKYIKHLVIHNKYNESTIINELISIVENK